MRATHQSKGTDPIPPSEPAKPIQDVTHLHPMSVRTQIAAWGAHRRARANAAARFQKGRPGPRHSPGGAGGGLQRSSADPPLYSRLLTAVIAISVRCVCQGKFGHVPAPPPPDSGKGTLRCIAGPRLSMLRVWVNKRYARSGVRTQQCWAVHTADWIIQRSPNGVLVLGLPWFVGHTRWPAFHCLVPHVTCRPLLKAGTQWARPFGSRSGVQGGGRRGSSSATKKATPPMALAGTRGGGSEGIGPVGVRAGPGAHGAGQKAATPKLGAEGGGEVFGWNGGALRSGRRAHYTPKT